MQDPLIGESSDDPSFRPRPPLNPIADIAVGDRRQFTLIPGITWQAGLTFIILCVISSLPFFMAKMPAIGDYPNHLARFYIIGHSDDPILSNFYLITWRLIPDLAGDVIVPRFNRIFDVFVAGKLFVLLDNVFDSFRHLCLTLCDIQEVEWLSSVFFIYI